MRNLHMLICLSLAGLVLSGCRSTPKARTAYEPVPIDVLRAQPDRYANHQVAVTGYILGMEYYRNDDDADVWVLALGSTPQLDDSRADQLIFPDVPEKVRVAEDGYNREVLSRCYEICKDTRRKGDQVTVFGVALAGRPYEQYAAGIDVALSQIQIGNRVLSTDFEDRSKFQEKTPGVLRKGYGGIKKIAGFIGKAI